MLKTEGLRELIHEVKAKDKSQAWHPVSNQNRNISESVISLGQGKSCSVSNKTNISLSAIMSSLLHMNKMTIHGFNFYT